MNSLVVFFAVVAVAVAAPSTKTDKRSYEHISYSVPSSLSHQSLLHSSPSLIAAPAEYASVVSEPVLSRAIVSPSVYTGAVSHQSRLDVHHTPTVISSAPLVSEQHVVAAPAVVEARSVYSPSVYSPSVYSPSVYTGASALPAVYSGASALPSVYSGASALPAVYGARSVYSPSAALYSGASSLSSVYGAGSVYSPASHSAYSPSVYSSNW